MDDMDREHYIESEVRNDKLVTHSFYMTWDIWPREKGEVSSKLLKSSSCDF